MDPEWQSGHWRKSLSRWWWRWCVASGAGGAERGQQITVEWGPYLGYGGGSGVWKGRWGGSHYFWSPHCYCTGRSRASACLSEPLPGGRKSVGGREKNPRTRQQKWTVQDGGRRYKVRHCGANDIRKIQRGQMLKRRNKRHPKWDVRSIQDEDFLHSKSKVLWKEQQTQTVL